MNKLMKLIKSNNHVTVDGRVGRLFWQNKVDLVSDIPITEENKFWLDEGWAVVTWKGSKTIFHYFGNSMDEAIEAFKKLEEIE